MDRLPVAVWRLDAEGRTQGGNERLAALFGGVLPDGLEASGIRYAAKGRGPFGLPPGEEVEAVLPVAGRPAERQLILVASDWMAGGAMLVVLDVTRLLAARDQAVHGARLDALTGLPNRLGFQEALEAVGGPGAGAGALLLLDLQGVRAVNDTLGHAAGDALLQEAARRLEYALRPGEALFRLGGDEFAVLASGLEGEAAASLAERLQRALSPPFTLGAGTVAMRASMGHAHGLGADDAEVLHRAAALALAHSKRHGQGTITAHDPALAEAVAWRLDLREKLAAALAGGGLALAWQKQVDGRSGALRGAEALLRWPGAPEGAGAPPVFLAEAEAMGLMPAVDAWVLEEALRQKAAWTQAGTGPEVVGINVSPGTLKDMGFPGRVQAALARHGVPAEALEVEIPEDVAAQDLDAIAPVLHELIADGVRLSLDDFGGGRSALAHLLRLPVDQVKLDRSIVSGLPGGARERVILRAVATLARGMEIPLLAEGVETEEQRDALLEAGCVVMQGWLFGRAVTAGELVPAV